MNGIDAPRQVASETPAPRQLEPKPIFRIAPVLACIVLWHAAAGAMVAAMQVPEALSPEERVEAVKRAMEETKPGEATAPEEKSEVVLSGRFTTPQGQSPGSGYARLIRPSVHSSLRVADDGTFRVSMPANTRVVLIPLLDGFATRAYGPFQIDDEASDVGALAVTQGFEGKIRVTDQRGQPVAGATVTSATLWVESDEGGRSGIGVREFIGAASDQDGLLKLPHASADQPIELSLQKGGYEFDRRDVRFADTKTISWGMKAAEPTTGRVVDAESGTPVSGAQIYLVRREGFAPTGVRDPRNDHTRIREGDSVNRDARPLAASDEDGRFSIDTWRSDSRYWVAVLSRDHRPRLVEDVASGQRLGEIPLDPPLTVRGRLIGDLSDLPRTRNGRRKLAYRNVLQVEEHSYSDLFAVPVEPDGTFQIDQLFPGDLQLLLPGGAKHLHVSEPIAEVAIDLSKPGGATGEDHRPLHVTLEPTAGQPLRGQVRLSWSMPHDKTEDQGQPRHATFDASSQPIHWNAPAGATVWIHDVGLIGSRLARSKVAVVADGSGPQKVAVPVEPAGAVTGRVLSANGDPVEAFRLMVDRNLRADSTELSLAAEEFQHPEGRFTITGLPLKSENQYRIFAVVDGSGQATSSDSFRISPEQPVARLTIQMPPAIALRGRVVDYRGQPVAGATLSVTAEQMAEAHAWSRSLGIRPKTEPDGRFQLSVSERDTGLAYEMRVHPTREHAGQTLRISPQRWPDDGSLGTLRLSRAATVHGRVLGSDGAPRSGIHVMLMPVDREAAEYRGHRSDRTGAEGRFQVEGLEPIRQKLYVHGGGVLEVQGPFSQEQDEFGNPYWAVQPEQAIDAATIIIE